MENRILEVCVDSYSSAIAAYEGGADRLELCQNLIIGGTTPDLFLFEKIKDHIPLPVHVLLRPRFGDFCYSEDELEIIEKNAWLFQKAGADGIVCGALCPDGSLDEEAIKRIISDSENIHHTLHRAFDVCKDPLETMETAKKLGFDTILTSGQKNNCTEGAKLLKELQQKSEGIRIMAGGGVNAMVIKRLLPDTGITAWHMSGKKEIPGSMRYRKEGIAMGVCGISEYIQYQTSADAVRNAKEALVFPG